MWLSSRSPLRWREGATDCYVRYLPPGRHDLLIDIEDGISTRVQCKTGVLREGRVQFRVYSVSDHRTRGLSYRGQVDAFGVYRTETRTTYLVPIAAVAVCGRLACLRSYDAERARAARLASEFLIGALPLRRRVPATE
ncbi:MAG: hypothetical protein AUH85_14230 [Chloroflexi bacterium 13_1_40CM_4_68_4]|nr:MAG: hypothetical protein AUH85_14230 [Chloroflexi bacterium 13_1_40CM_4_68_4]